MLYVKRNNKKATDVILIFILNTIMQAERQAYLEVTKIPKNKANGYRPVSILIEKGRSLILSIPRDRLMTFRPYLIDVLKSEGKHISTVCAQLYYTRFPTQQIKKLFEQIYTPKYAPKTIVNMVLIFKKQLKNILKQQLSSS